MRFTQQLRYSLCGVFDLAYHRDDSPVRIEEIGRRQGIPARYLEQIFQKLRRAGLVVSKRGPGGGYLLARAPEQITLADVILAVQGAVIRHEERDAGTAACERTNGAAARRGGATTRLPRERDGLRGETRRAARAQESAHALLTHSEDEGSLEFISELVERRIIEALEGETIAGLCREALRRGIPRAAASPLMYEI